MLLFNLKNKYLAADGAEGGAAGNGSSGAEETTLESVMNSASDKGPTQNEPESDPGKSEAEESETGDGIPTWMSQLPKEMRTDDLKGFDKISDMVNAYKELAKKSGDQTQGPGPDAKPEEIQAFYEKLGKPKDADGYKFEGADNDESNKLFRDAAFNANLTQSQAQNIYKTFTDIAKQQYEDSKKEMTKTYEATEKALKDEYGNKYSEKLALLQRGMTNYVTPELQKQLSQRGLLYNKDLVELFITLGEESSEAGATQKGSGSKGYVPLSEGGMFDFKE